MGVFLSIHVSSKWSIEIVSDLKSVSQSVGFLVFDLTDAEYKLCIQQQQEEEENEEEEEKRRR